MPLARLVALLVATVVSAHHVDGEPRDRKTSYYEARTAFDETSPTLDMLGQIATNSASSKVG